MKKRSSFLLLSFQVGIELNDNGGAPPFNPVDAEADGDGELSPFLPLP